MFIFTHCQYCATINLLLSPFLRCCRYLPELYVYLSAFTNVNNGNIAESVRESVVRYDYCVCRTLRGPVRRIQIESKFGLRFPTRLVINHNCRFPVRTSWTENPRRFGRFMWPGHKRRRISSVWGTYTLRVFPTWPWRECVSTLDRDTTYALESTIFYTIENLHRRNCVKSDECRTGLG